MRTKLIEQPALPCPRLERYRPDGSLAEETPLQSFPFILGRSDSAELQLDSSRVSREHLEIIRQGKVYRVRDLGSTNGTFLNGRPVTEAELNDGDLLLVADVELVFFLGKAEPLRQAVTQMIDRQGDRQEQQPPPRRLVAEVRRIHQVVTRRGVVPRFRPVVQLEDQSLLAFEAVGRPRRARLPATRLVASTDCRLIGRVRQLERLVAVEEAARLPAAAAIFVQVDTCEIGDEGLIDSLGQLASSAAGRRLVVEIPDDAAGDTPQFAAIHARLSKLGIPLAYGEFSSGPARIAHRAAIAPQFLKLSPSLTRAVRRNRQRAGQVEAIVRAAGQLGIEVIATGLADQADVDACGRLGCRWGSGRQLGEALPLEAWCAKEYTPPAATGKLPSIAFPTPRS